MKPGRLSTSDAVARVEPRLQMPDEASSRPALILISGLPGTGKSFVSRLIAKELPVVVVQSDFVRKTLFRVPTYSAEESAFVYGVSHALIASLLSRGFNVVFDATNLVEGNREVVYRLADRAGARLIVVKTVAPSGVARGRLRRRAVQRDPDDWSDADERVYERMKPTEQPIRRNHLVVDTSKDVASAVTKIVREARR